MNEPSLFSKGYIAVQIGDVRIESISFKKAIPRLIEQIKKILQDDVFKEYLQAIKFQSQTTLGSSYAG